MWLEVRAPEYSQTGWSPAAPPSAGETVTRDTSATRTDVCGSSDPAARAADAAALQALYRRDLRVLLTLVGRVVRSSSDAEDIVQDAFLRVWRAMELGTVRSPRAVLFRTAYNLALNHVRSPRNRRHDPAPASAEPMSDALSAEDQMVLNEDLEACKLAFAQLPLRCRETMTLRVVEELSYKEISERLGISVSTLEKRFVRGRTLCRDIMQGGTSLRTNQNLMLAAE